MKGKFLRQDAERAGRRVMERLSPVCEQMEIAGSVRRQVDVVGDVDIVASASDIAGAMSVLKAEFGAPAGANVQAQVQVDGVSADVWFVPPQSYGAALLFTTGSALFNIGCRTMARDLGFKLSQYGLYERGTDKLVASRSEQEVLEALGLKWVPPEKRSVQTFQEFWKLIDSMRLRD